MLKKQEPRYDLEVANSAKDGLAKVKNTPYEAILLDYRIPDMNGLEFLDRLNEISENPPPVIMVTAMGSEELAARAMKKGICDYITKNSEYLLNMASIIHNAVKRFRALKERDKILSRFNQIQLMLNTIMEKFYPFLLVLDNELKIIGANRNFCDFIGSDLESIKGKYLTDLVQPEDLPRLNAILPLEAKAPIQISFFVKKITGEPKEFLFWAIPSDLSAIQSSEYQFYGNLLESTFPITYEVQKERIDKILKNLSFRQHEINNSLSVVLSSIELLERMIENRDEKIDSVLDKITHGVRRILELNQGIIES